MGQGCRKASYRVGERGRFGAVPLLIGTRASVFDLRVLSTVGGAAMSASSVCVITNALRLQRQAL